MEISSGNFSLNMGKSLERKGSGEKRKEMGEGERHVCEYALYIYICTFFCACVCEVGMFGTGWTLPL
jgi:hypothetical protein